MRFSLSSTILCAAGLTVINALVDGAAIRGPVDRRRQLFARAAEDVFANDMCPLDDSTLAGEMFTSFNAIIFSDFIAETSGFTFDGRVAVGRNITFTQNHTNSSTKATNVVTVNDKGPVSCLANPADNFSSYGLVHGNPGLAVNGTATFEVKGSVFGAGNSSAFNVTAEDCRVYTEESPRFNVSLAKQVAKAASMAVARERTTDKMEKDGTIRRIARATGGYRVFTFSTALPKEYANDTSIYSDPSRLFDESSPAELQGDIPGPEDTVVFNIPVPTNRNTTFDGPRPGFNFNQCNIIYNIFPVDAEGEFDENGNATVVFRGSWDGIVLAPLVQVNDTNPSGAISGAFIGDSYLPKNATRMRGFEGTQTGCSLYGGCFPIPRATAIEGTTAITIANTVTETMTSSPAETIYEMPYYEEDTDE